MKLTDKVQYYARKLLFLSILDPVTYERQAFLNKFYLGVIVMLCVALWNIGSRFAALENEIADRRAKSNARVQQWNERVSQDSVQRLQWEALKTKELAKKLKQQDDSILSQFGKSNGR